METIFFSEKHSPPFPLATNGRPLRRKDALPILERAEIISKRLPFSQKANIFYRLNKLINKNFMGEVFKVMLLTKNKEKFKLGF